MQNCKIEELNDNERFFQEYFNCIGQNGLNLCLTATNSKCGLVRQASIDKNRETHKKLYAEGKSHLIFLNQIQKGTKNPFYGKNHTKDSKELMSKERRSRSKESKDKGIQTRKNNYQIKNHPNYGKNLKKETCELISKKSKQRLAVFYYNAKKVIDIETLIVYKDANTVNNANLNFKKCRRELCRILNLSTYNPTKLMYVEVYENTELKTKALEKNGNYCPTFFYYKCKNKRKF